jgi:galactose-1-phosphate uridylyltransferase
MQAYCVKCRTKRDMQNPREEKTKNGRPIIKGKCPVCGTNLNIIGKTIAQMK